MDTKESALQARESILSRAFPKHTALYERIKQAQTNSTSNSVSDFVKKYAIKSQSDMHTFDMYAIYKMDMKIAQLEVVEYPRFVSELRDLLPTQVHIFIKENLIESPFNTSIHDVFAVYRREMREAQLEVVTFPQFQNELRGILPATDITDTTLQGWYLKEN